MSLNEASKKAVLVTGGAGYIGSHAVKVLCDSGFTVTVVDNLSAGHLAAVDVRARFEEMDLGDLAGLCDVMERGRFDAVMHFAGSIEVGLSMKEPDLFFRNNVVCGQNLLEAMRRAGCGNIVFSSTAAVYGSPKQVPIPETARLFPTNYYGVTKMLFEELLKSYEVFYGINYIALRYFNAAGADSSGNLGEAHDPETHLIPLVLRAAAGGFAADSPAKTAPLKIFGTDYDTPDGTCIRDYIHVTDLVKAHVLALDYLLRNGKSDVFNLANGKGFSVREVISAAEKVTGKKIPYKDAARREGDPPVLIADCSKAKKVLGWEPVHSSLEEIIASAHKWHSSQNR
ncbi:UDP-glucose 4-epimerase GalE [Patescibacteria group bacterium]|nr:UDP-glucose 4-epimerase GalE [Patescibacteria group bacterium]MBU1703198.1 UDP-glucose 4-epimerase GalE [Patescibacteria group bacterium]MBU1953518.1 UDP-glucose 4-epimerase GalE [Patescibacteria group bacterium]